MNTPVHRCGTIAVVGRPNVGKSTLTNALIGTKISIVSRKAQTTRHRILGVLTRENEQFVFVDTPGFQTRHGGTMNRMMNRVVTQALVDVDVVLFVVEAGKWSPGDAKLLALLGEPERTILVISKIDQIKDRDSLYPFVQSIVAQYPFAAIVPVSSTKRHQLDQLLDEIARRLPENEPFYDADTLTDRPVRFIAAELIREKIFRLVGDELPYGCIVERDSHRPILLGAGGQHMKRIATEARLDIAKLLDKPVHLEVYIKVRKGWADKEGSLRELGYE